MFHHHAPAGYICPICLGIQSIETEDTLLRQADLVYKDELVSVFINSFWVESAEGHVIVVPNEHYENIYELPQASGHRIFEVTQKVTKAMKQTYKCDGITIRQNNEPAADQHAFHYHQHIFPRYNDDQFNENCTKPGILSQPEDRVSYAAWLKAML